MKALARLGALIEEEMSRLIEMEADAAVAPLQSAACTYRIAVVPRPRFNLIRYYGNSILALNARLRNEIIPDNKNKGNAFETNSDVPLSSVSVSISWVCLFVLSAPLSSERQK